MIVFMKKNVMSNALETITLTFVFHLANECSRGEIYSFEREGNNVRKVDHTASWFDGITTDIPVIHSVQLERPYGSYSTERWSNRIIYRYAY